MLPRPLLPLAESRVHKHFEPAKAAASANSATLAADSGAHGSRTACSSARRLRAERTSAWRRSVEWTPKINLFESSCLTEPISTDLSCAGSSSNDQKSSCPVAFHLLYARRSSSGSLRAKRGSSREFRTARASISPSVRACLHNPKKRQAPMVQSAMRTLDYISAVPTLCTRAIYMLSVKLSDAFAVVSCACARMCVCVCVCMAARVANSKGQQLVDECSRGSTSIIIVFFTSNVDTQALVSCLPGPLKMPMRMRAMTLRRPYTCPSESKGKREREGTGKLNELYTKSRGRESIRPFPVCGQERKKNLKKNDCRCYARHWTAKGKGTRARTAKLELEKETAARIAVSRRNVASKAECVIEFDKRAELCRCARVAARRPSSRVVSIFGPRVADVQPQRRWLVAYTTSCKSSTDTKRRQNVYRGSEGCSCNASRIPIFAPRIILAHKCVCAYVPACLLPCQWPGSRLCVHVPARLLHSLRGHFVHVRRTCGRALPLCLCACSIIYYIRERLDSTVGAAAAAAAAEFKATASAPPHEHCVLHTCTAWPEMRKEKNASSRAESRRSRPIYICFAAHGRRNMHRRPLLRWHFAVAELVNYARVYIFTSERSRAATATAAAAPARYFGRRATHAEALERERERKRVIYVIAAGRQSEETDLSNCSSRRRVTEQRQQQHFIIVVLRKFNVNIKNVRRRKSESKFAR
ncbi:unnamed protein product [Trichogramma brassicae]|uniref:Uncharacterized protein n=1 Tax=Trichogramma brassicae TaxID=86971 RepID=A0A6H5J244_9HYME|nr:unnamed protein product [Trichogramma brassicae]